MSSVLPCEPVSILMCTRNRPEDLKKALPGVLAQDYPDYEVVLIDQSTNDESETWVRENYGANSRLRFTRTPTVGLSIARNLALTEARSDICAFTDDDCAVPPHWLSNVVRVYREHPETHILFSPVHIPQEMHHRTDLNFPCLYFEDDRTLEKGEIFGMGANMSLRKSFWEAAGPFDAMLGPGTPLPGSDEHDWLYRAHLAGAVIRLEPHNSIEHFAWRDRDLWNKLSRTYAYGDAAFAMKHLRCGDYRMIGMLAERLGRMGARCVLRILQRNPGYTYEWNYVAGYWLGIWGSLRYTVNHQSRLYQPLTPSRSQK